jgi:hypothetical protein
MKASKITAWLEVRVSFFVLNSVRVGAGDIAASKHKALGSILSTTKKNQKPKKFC